MDKRKENDIRDLNTFRDTFPIPLGLDIMNSLELGRRLEQFQEGLEELAPEVPKSTAPRIEGWSDEKLLQLRTLHKFDSSCCSRASLRKILVRFYKFYLTGSVSLEDNAVAIVSDATAIAMVSYKRIWPDELFGETPFYVKNTSNVESLDVPAHGAAPEVVSIIPGMTEEQRVQYLKLIKTYTEDEVKLFKETLKRIISAISPNESATRQEQQLIQLTGFLALTMWRGATKNKDQLTNAFLKTQYIQNLNAIADWPLEWGFSPPCTQCIELVTSNLQKGRPSTSAMFTLIASQYVIVRQTEAADGATAAMLSATVLTHTARNGLGMLQLLEHAEMATGQKWTKLCRMSYFNVTIDHWEMIKLFFKTYLKRANLQFGYNWARIINDGFLRDYSPKEMLPLAGILAGVIEQQQGRGIWDAEWAKGHVEHLAEMRELGKALFELTKLTKEGTIAAPASQPTLARAMKSGIRPTTEPTEADVIADMTL